MRIALALMPAWMLAQGLPPEWELRDQVKSLVEQTRRFSPLLDQFDPQQWIAQGAPDLYAKQFDDLKLDVRYVQEAAQGLAAQPDRLSRAFDLYERMQRLEARAPSIADAVRRYQNPAAADLLIGLLNETSASRDKMRQYIRDLIQTRDAERDVLEKEAQKCRVTQTRTVQPVKPKPGAKK
jgi:hypothetical protein